MAGYSKTPLVKKLGIKPEFAICLLNAPENYDDTLGDLPPGVEVRPGLGESLDFIQFFTTSRVELDAEFPALKAAIAPHGMIWISWPKGKSSIKTDLTGNLVREIGLAYGLVDVKVCAVDDDWSGLKFVYRLKDRE